MEQQPEPGRIISIGRQEAGERRQNSFWGRLAVVALVPILFFGLYTVADRWVLAYRLRAEVAQIREEIEAERLENVRLQQELVAARSDQAIEDAARRQLNLVRPGDQPVVLLGPTPEPRPTTGLRDREEADSRPPWLAWLLRWLGQ